MTGETPTCRAAGGDGCGCSYEPYDMGGYTARRWLCERGVTGETPNPEPVRTIRERPPEHVFEDFRRIHGLETPQPLDVLRHAVAMNITVEGRTEKTLREAAALAQMADLAEAAQELLQDDDMPNHWNDCVCSYCVRNRALRAALVPFAARENTND